MNWYNMKNSGASAEINIFGEIGWEVNAAQFAADLKALGDPAEITLRINSPGGSIIEGTAVFNQLLRHPARIVASIDGWAASMASVIAMAADEIEMPDNAWMVIHNPWAVAMGEAEEMRKQADLLDRMKETIVTAYMRHAKIARAEIEKLMDAATWMTGAEAVEKGFATRATGALELAASAKNQNLKNIPDAARALFAALEAPPAPPAPEEQPPADPPKEDPPVIVEDPPPAPVESDEAKRIKELEASAENLRTENARIAGELEAMRTERDGLSGQLADARTNAANLQDRIGKMTGGMLATVDQGGNIDGIKSRWVALVREHGYAKARTNFPQDFANFMANAPKNLP